MDNMKSHHAKAVKKFAGQLGDSIHLSSTVGRARSPDRAGAVRKQKIGFVAARHPSKMAPIRGRNDSQIFLGHLAQSPGMVETIPYRLVYNV